MAQTHISVMRRGGIPLILMLGLYLSSCATAPSGTSPAPVEDRSETSPATASVEYDENRTPADATDMEPSRPGAAVRTLLGDAAVARGEQRLTQAAMILERALRIEPRNPMLWQRLAQLRLEQGKPQLAENLALKSNALAGGDRVLQKTNWQLVARARRTRSDLAGADQAREKAASF